MRATPDRPAPIVPIAAALVLGAAWGGARPAPVAAGAAAVAGIAIAIAMRRRPVIVVVFAAAAVFALGVAAQGRAWRETGRRLDETFRGSVTRDVEVVARVVATPERLLEGGRTLTLEVLSGDIASSLRFRVHVAEPPEDDAARFDRLRCGDSVRAWCRLRAPSAGSGVTAADVRRRLASERVDATGRVKSSRLVRLVAAGDWSPGRALDSARVRARSALDRTFGKAGETRAVLGAMLLGDRGLLDEDTNSLLRDAGLVHILSISGLHTALSIVLLLALLRGAGLGARGLLLAGGASLAAFSTFVGHGASVWRACACLGVGLLARAVGRDVDPLAALALAAALLVAAVPPLAWSVGFLLSVLATAGLLAPPLLRTAGRQGSSGPRHALSASTGAYLATAPLLATVFGRLAPAAFVANLVAAPLCAACLASGAASIVLSGVPIAGVVAAHAAEASVGSLLFVARHASSIPGGHLRVAPPSQSLVAVYVAFLLGTWLWKRGWNGAGGRAVRLMLALCAIALHMGPMPPGPGPARAEILDVGQGLAVVVRGTDGRFVLSDAGPSGRGRFDAGDRIVVPSLAAQGCRRLEALAISHDHDDHAGGARAVLRDVEVGELWVPEGSLRDPLIRAVTAEAVARGVAVRRLRRGDRLAQAGMIWSALHPGIEDRDRSINDRCLVLCARAPSGATILLPGDLEAEGERALLASGADPRAGALVAPHHGADGSSTTAFLDRVRPSLVLVSAGRRNRFGHPGDAALARVAAVGARLCRTDRDGTIALQEGRASWVVSLHDEGREDQRRGEDHGEQDRDR